VRVAILKVTRWRTGSQWSWTNAGVIWSRRLSWLWVSYSRPQLHSPLPRENSIQMGAGGSFRLVVCDNVSIKQRVTVH